MPCLKSIVSAASPSQVALAWLLYQPGISTVIIGARKEEQLVDNLKSAELELSADELKRLDEVSRLAPEYPGWIPPAERGVDRMKRLEELTERK